MARDETRAGDVTHPLEATHAYGERLARALLGVDALYRQESGDEDGLVVLNMDTEGRYPPEPFADYAEAARGFRGLEGEAAGLPEADRRVYYAEVCRSTLAFVAWRTKGLSFTDQLSGFLHVPAAPAPEAELDEMQDHIRALLTRMGYTGDLRQQAADWEERNRVPPDEVEGVLSSFLDEAWTRTEERLLEIPADRSDGMRVSTVRGVPYNARCDYLNRTVELNVDPALTRPGLKHLAVHEGCPGHYVQFKLRESMAGRGQACADVLLSVVNTASSSVFEGIADAGLEMLGWVDSDDDRLQTMMNRYRAGIGTGAAWRLHALKWAPDAVASWLRGRSLVGGEGWVENRMRFISSPSRAALIWSYWWGERVVTPVWRRVAADRRSEFLRFLHGRMHSNGSVAMFDSDGREG
ncbi:MAG: hypothetical protein P8170_03730 [Gemmatimonadota bacterium]